MHVMLKYMIRLVILAGKIAVNSATKLFIWEKWTYTESSVSTTVDGKVGNYSVVTIISRSYDQYGCVTGHDETPAYIFDSVYEYQREYCR